MGQIQVSFSLSLSVWKISWLSKTLLYLGNKARCGCSSGLWVFTVDFTDTFSCTLGGNCLSVGWAEKVKKPLLLCVIIFFSLFHFHCTAK